MDARTESAEQPKEAVLPALLRPIEAVCRRVRLQRAFDVGALCAAVALGGALASVGARRLGLFELPAGLAWTFALLPVLGALVGWLRPLPPLLAPQLLDRAHGTNDLLASALSFSRLSRAERTPFMEACVASAARAAASAQPESAAPLVAPSALRIAAMLMLGTAALLVLPEAPPQAAIAPPPAPKKPKLLHEEDVTLATAEIAPLLPALAEDPALAPVRDELNELLEALKDERLERAEALLALRALEERLSIDELAEDQAAHDEALRALGKQLGGGGPEQALAEAMAQADAEQAQEQAEQLAQQLGSEAPSKQDAQLERALRRAGERPKDGEQARERAKKERERLLQKKQDPSSQSPEQQRLLQKKQRELDQLERELERQERAERELDELRRELGDSAKSMSERNRQDAQQHMQKGARALQQLAKKKLSAEQRQALAKKLQQLRELISKQRGQDGKDGQKGTQPGGEPQAGDGQQRLDLSRFGKLARGQGEGEGDQPGDGDQPGQGDQPKQLVPGQGQEGEPGLMLSGESGEQAHSSQDAPEAVGGSRAGHGGRPELQAEASARDGQHVDTRVEGQHGDGPTRSEVIHEAGQRGFASLPYQKVHGEYARHAERVLERDHVPGGYKFYVRRYFQLIRPREDAPP